MGLVILPLAFLIAAAWLSAVIFAAFSVERFARNLLRGNKLSYLVYPLFLFLGWWLPNIPGLRDQQRMDSIATQCGWTYLKQVTGVEGIYIDSERAQSISGELLSIYGATERLLAPREYPLEKNRIARWDRNSAVNPTFIEMRTFRYGIRESRTLASTDIWREEFVVWDFDAQEPLGQRVEYGFVNSPSPSSFLEYALYHLRYQPKPCGYTNPGRTDIQPAIKKLLRPAAR